ncbi:unnamed protein product [Merluccius merluccius]
MSCCHMTKWPVIAVDGGWGAWSAWAACGEDCERQRSRDCAEPEPRHGGRPCDGVALAADNCTGGLCTQNRRLLHDVKPQGRSSGARVGSRYEVERGSDIALYSGLSAGVLTVVVLVVVVTLYRRNHSEYGVDVIDSSALTGGFQSFTFKTSRQGNPLLINSSMQPDLSVSRTYTSPMCFQDSMDKELMADHSLLDPLPDIKVKGISERAEYHVMSHPRTFPRGVAPDYKGVGVDATLCRRGRTLFIPHGLPSLARPPPPPLPPPLKTTRVFGQAGGRLVVPNTGVSLLVPYGGIAEDTSWEMYMIINQEDSRIKWVVVVQEEEEEEEEEEDWVVVENWVVVEDWVVVVEDWVVVVEDWVVVLEEDWMMGKGRGLDGDWVVEVEVEDRVVVVEEKDWVVVVVVVVVVVEVEDRVVVVVVVDRVVPRSIGLRPEAGSQPRPGPWPRAALAPANLSTEPGARPAWVARAAIDPCEPACRCERLSFAATLSIRLREEGEEVLLSPEVTYGPSGLDLSCPVALSVAHCADLSGTNNNWSVRLKRRTQDNKWERAGHSGKRFANRYTGGLRRCGDSQLHSQQEVMSVDEESACCYCLLEAERCHLLLGRPGRYALVGQPLSQEAAKRLRLAVFGSPDAGNPLGYNLRVYCVDDTPHALQVSRGETAGGCG